jgi:hypothetical protein
MNLPTLKMERITHALVVFSATFPVFYGWSDVGKWPLFSYYPATCFMRWGWAPETDDDGPAMYWYGWLASSVIAAGLTALLVAVLPSNWRRQISVHCAWVVPLFMMPIMAYTLRVYWR